jgi:hypothetical protein
MTTIYIIILFFIIGAELVHNKSLWTAKFRNIQGHEYKVPVQDVVAVYKPTHFITSTTMDAHIERHQPLITARLIFAPKSLPPPPIITARMEFPLFSIPRERSLTPERHTTPKRAPTPKRHPTPQRNATPTRNRLQRNSMAFENSMDVDHDPDAPESGDLGSPLTSLSDEDRELESEEDGEVNGTKISKPPGEAGRPQSGGYNLQEKLGWNDKTYGSVIVSMSKVYMEDSDRNYRLWCTKWQKPS